MAARIKPVVYSTYCGLLRLFSGPLLTPEVRHYLAYSEPFHETAMHLAIWCRNERALELMMRAGANCMFRNRHGTTVLQYAVLFGSPAMVHMLLAHVPLDQRTLVGDWEECNLVPMSCYVCIGDYTPKWAWDLDDPARPPNFIQERVANVDSILWATRGLWTCDQLRKWIRQAHDNSLPEDPLIPEVVQVVQGYLRWTAARQAWVGVVVCW